ncbi:MAG TPA: shikimate kinase [Tepidisphaeraceae bacterium]|jgi:shikimate kinase
MILVSCRIGDFADNPDSMGAILIGYRGCGKSTIGKRLADNVWAKFVDTDVLVVQAAGKMIKDIFEQNGEEYFRQLETEALRQALSQADHIVAVGGGAVMKEENRAMIKASGFKCIYLRCEPEALLARIQNDNQSGITRPPLTQLGGGIEEVKHLVELREPMYRLIMTGELDVTNLTPEEAATYITRLL